MCLPHLSCPLLNHDLLCPTRYFVPNPSFKGKGDDKVPETLELLKGITGYAEPGYLTALMGGSGEGMKPGVQAMTV